MLNSENRKLNLNNHVLTRNEMILLGAYFKLHRKKQELSLENFCDTLKLEDSITIVKGNLSEFENGKRNLKNSIIERLFQILNIEIYDCNQFDISLNPLIAELFNQFCDLDTDAEKQLFNDILENKPYEYSLNFLQYYLIELMYNIRITHNQEHINNLLLQLDQYSHLLNDNEYALYMLYKGINAFNIHNYPVAENNLQEALNKIGNDFHSFKGIVYYYMNFIMQEQNNPIEAMKYCQRAIDEFSKVSNFSRILSLKMHLGSCYSRLNQFADAKKLYFEVIDKMNSINRANFKKVIYYNLSGLLLKMGEYSETIKYSRIAFSSGKIVPYSFIYIPYSLYRLDRKDEMLKEIEIATAHPDITDIQIIFFKSLINKVNNKEDTAIKFLKQYYRMIVKQKNIETEIFALRILWEWLVANKQYEEAVEYGDQLIKLTSNYI